MVNSDTQRDRWYLDLMAPNIKGEKFAWLDPSGMYSHGRAFKALAGDLAEPFREQDVQVVAGLDAMGFILGTALAMELGTGILPLRKAGKIPLNTDSVTFTNYSGRTQDMEIRDPAFKAGTRILLVDQWVETGGTMNAAIDLVTRQRGVIAGIAAVCIEENDATRLMREAYLCVTAVVPGTARQAQCNNQHLDSFRDYQMSHSFPETD